MACMANRLKVQEQQTILDLKRRSWTIRRIARELRVSRNTVRAYLRAVASSPGQNVPDCREGPPVQTDPLSTAGSVSKPVQSDPLSTAGSAATPPQNDPLSRAGHQGRKSLCVELEAPIRDKLRAGLTAQRIYQDLQIEVTFRGSYESVNRFVAKLRQKEPDLVQRIEVQPGEEVQVDFGAGPVLIGADGKRRRTWIFRLVLSFSRKESVSYCALSVRSKTRAELGRPAGAV